MIRFFFLADTHLGFDQPARPRVKRRRRGPDFFANYQRVLDGAVQERVDFLIHGGDLLFRSRVPPELVQRAFLPLKKVADQGIPVVLVPGNHERGRIPFALLAEHPRIHIFHKPTTFRLNVRGVQVGLAGFPYCRDDVRTRMPDLVQDTGWDASGADVHLLCVHHCFEGATVGPADFMFRGASDVIRHVSVPPRFAAVLSGHIHRHQVLTRDLSGQPLAVPVLYPGSVERTSFAEQHEPKGFLDMTLSPSGGGPRGWIAGWTFRELPARPMVVREITCEGKSSTEVEAELRKTFSSADDQAVLQLRVRGRPSRDTRTVLSAAHIRSLHPDTMNVDVVWVDVRRSGAPRDSPERSATDLL